MKKKLTLIGIIGCALFSTIALSSFDGKAAGTNPITMLPIESQGAIVYDMDGGDDIAIYSSDLVNLNNEINALGVYTDEQVTGLDTRIATALADVQSGKTTLATKINSKTGTTTVTTTNPTWVQLSSGVDTVYTKGYNAGISASQPTYTSRSVSRSDSGSSSSSAFTAPSNGYAIVVGAMGRNGGGPDCDSSVYIKGTRMFTEGHNGVSEWIWAGAISKGQTIYCSAWSEGGYCAAACYIWFYPGGSGAAVGPSCILSR